MSIYGWRQGEGKVIKSNIRNRNLCGSFIGEVHYKAVHNIQSSFRPPALV